jgi:hypothetical protein
MRIVIYIKLTYLIVKHTNCLFKIILFISTVSTVKPVHNDHPWEHERWLITLTSENIKLLSLY